MEIREKIVAFLRDIGLPVRVAAFDSQSLMPGIQIDHGVLVVDEARLLYPGDVLHEAGHLAVMTPARRRQIHQDVGRDGGEELAAIAWSYAAALYLQLDPAVVFHEHGYRGGSSAILENFADGRYFGVPYLQWIGLTCEPRPAKERSVPPYPHMLKWLRDE